MDILLSGILLMSFAMVTAKRVPALISSFSIQSAFLFIFTLFVAMASKHLELYIIASLLFLLKVIIIPYFLRRIAARIKVRETLGLYINPALSVFVAVLLTFTAYLFSERIILLHDKLMTVSFAVSLSVTLIGMFVMISRVNALAQIIGLLAMENGLFLAASVISGGMPFFVEIAIFFDLFVCVAILGIFVYKINKLFTHIDVNKLDELKG